MKFCTNCGAEIADESKFCSNCGSKFEDVTEQVNEEVSPWGQEELDIKYEDDTYNSSVYSGSEIYQTPTPQYYESSVTSGAKDGNIGFSIAAMVCGIVSLVCCCFWYFSIILAIAAIVLGVISIKNGYEGKGMAIAGLVTGGITIFALIVLLILGGASMLFEL